MKKTIINTAVAAVLAAATQGATAATMEFNWTGNFTMLDSVGNAMGNTSAEKGTNSFQTAVTGTMAFDTATGAGTATLVPFDFFSGTAPAEAVGINMQAIGDGMGGAGSLVMGNMLFNWSGTNGIPVSIVLDAAGFFGATDAMWGDGVLDQADVAGYGAVPASDGTYTGSTYGYLGVGAVPISTTEWDLTQAADCGTAANSTTFADGGGCMSNGVSGVMPLVADTAENTAEYAQGDGAGIGGIPMWDGPFVGNNANFDILTLAMTNPDAGYTIAPNCDFSIGCIDTPQVPVPAAVWLFGSGLLGLVGVARRKKSEV